MSKKQKIIVSITGITIVMLILVGLTYAYFLTRIQGNTSEKSISVTTADLSLVYLDGNGYIEAENIEPGTVMPALNQDPKTFTVTNTGNATTEYGVFLINVINTFERTSDLQLTVTCTSSVANKNCAGYSDDMLDENNMLLSNSINAGETQYYELRLEYIEAGIDQSVDMNKAVGGLIQIYDLKETVDLTGTIAGYESGDYVGVHSDLRTSQIKDGTFKVVGLTPGTHTITLYEANGDERYSQQIVIRKGSSESISGTTATVTDMTRTITTAVTSSSVSISNVSIYQPYKSGSLANAIYNNAVTGTNGTVYRETPLTMVGHVPSLSGSQTSTVLNDYSNETYFGTKWVAYSQADYKRAENAIRTYRRYLDPENGDDDITGNSTAINEFLTSDCNSMVGKMVAIVETPYDAPYVYPEYLVTGCQNGKPVVTNKESELSKTPDDYGTSYYFRGSVTDNYLNFGGMCWRIVRIQGDGSIKLILEDKDATCDSGSYTGNFGIGTGQYGATNSITNPTYSNSGRNLANFETGNMKSAMTTWLGNSSINQSKLKSESWCFGDRTNMYFESINSGYDYGYNYGDLITNHSHSEIWDAAIAKNIKIMYEKLMNLSDDFETPLPSLVCTGETVNSIIGAISVDELDYAGGKVWKENNYYILNNYQKNNGKTFWSVSLAGYQKQNEKTFYVKPNGSITSKSVNDSNIMYRPSIVLNKSIVYTVGNGTQASPYIVS